MIFIYNSLFKQQEKYYTIKITELQGDNNNEVMITITDNSQSVLFSNERNHNELLKTMNATVNHELRNPINSIVAYNIQKERLYNELR